MKAQMEKLRASRDELLAEMEAIRNRIIGLEMAMSLLEEEADEAVVPKRRNVKATLLEMLESAGTSGLRASTAVEVAKRRGIDLDRGTVSSLLSRFKRDNIVSYDGETYRLQRFATERSTGSPGVFN